MSQPKPGKLNPSFCSRGSPGFETPCRARRIRFARRRPSPRRPRPAFDWRSPGACSDRLQRHDQHRFGQPSRPREYVAARAGASARIARREYRCKPWGGAVSQPASADLLVEIGKEHGVRVHRPVEIRAGGCICSEFALTVLMSALPKRRCKSASGRGSSDARLRREPSAAHAPIEGPGSGHRGDS